MGGDREGSSQGGGEVWNEASGVSVYEAAVVTLLEADGPVGAICADRIIQQQLYHVDTPAHAYELLHADETSEEFNYYLDDEEEE